MATVNFTCKIRIAWWFKYLYFPLFVFTAKSLAFVNPDFEPSFDRFDVVAKKAMKLEVK